MQRTDLQRMTYSSEPLPRIPALPHLFPTEQLPSTGSLRDRAEEAAPDWETAWIDLGGEG